MDVKPGHDYVSIHKHLLITLINKVSAICAS
jgi:hypothetical protein